jgi:hypothetical protein
MEQPSYSFTQDVLRTDIAGMPLEWIDYRTAASLYHAGQVAYVCGSPIYVLHGGVNSRTGLQSTIEVSSIVANTVDTYAEERSSDRYTPPLNNRTLYRRDANVCRY